MCCFFCHTMFSGMKRIRPRVNVNLPELDQVLEQARQTPLSDPDYQKLKDALHLLAGLLSPTRSTEKTSTLLAAGDDPSSADPPSAESPRTPPPGHGRNGAAAFTGAQKVVVAHGDLQAGQGCPACEKGKVYHQKEPKPLVRLVGQAPVAATVYELERLRCLCFMRHRQRYAACRTMPHPKSVSREEDCWKTEMLRTVVSRCGIIRTTIKGPLKKPVIGRRVDNDET